MLVGRGLLVLSSFTCLGILAAGCGGSGISITPEATLTPTGAAASSPTATLAPTVTPSPTPQPTSAPQAPAATTTAVIAPTPVLIPTPIPTPTPHPHGCRLPHRLRLLCPHRRPSVSARSSTGRTTRTCPRYIWSTRFQPMGSTGLSTPTERLGHPWKP